MKRSLIAFAMAVFVAACDGCEKPCSHSIPYPQPGSCGIPGAQPGELGGSCPGWPSGCSQGASCVSDVCLPCGGSTEPCCGIHNDCQSGLTCNHSSSYHPVCSGSCGQLNQGCCEDSVCGGGLTCVNKTCVTSNSSSACQGSTQYFVGIINKANRCAADPIPVMANDPAQATTCAEGVVQQLGLSGSVDLVSPTTFLNVGTGYNICSQSASDLNGSTVTIYAYSDADANVCGHGYCLTDCTITIEACTNQ